MGQRICYTKNNSGVRLGDLLLQHYEAFRLWYLREDRLATEGNYTFGHEAVAHYLQQAGDLAAGFDNLEQQLADELTLQFIGYCDLVENESPMLELFGPCCSTWRYEAGTEMVERTGDAEFIKLWHFLVTGRSLKNNAGFNSYEKGYNIGFLSREECLVLKTKIETRFGNRGVIKERYWTALEKKQEADARAKANGGPYGLSGHNPVSEGLELVLQMLDEMDDAAEVVTTIEC